MKKSRETAGFTIGDRMTTISSFTCFRLLAITTTLISVPCLILPPPPAVQILQHPEPAEDCKLSVEETVCANTSEASLKKRSKGRPQKPPKSPKPKKPKKVAKPSDEAGTASGSRRRPSRKTEGVAIDEGSLDISGIPTPVCSCTGKLQPYYRWGAGGWQSACCTTSISMYPLPMNTKRRGARIAGRKMSQGAFRKVLEKLIEEGHDLSNPIDLKLFWAKHGTNKLVTIRCVDIFTPEEQEISIKYQKENFVEKELVYRERRLIGKCPLTPEEANHSKVLEVQILYERPILFLKCCTVLKRSCPIKFCDPI